MSARRPSATAALRLTAALLAEIVVAATVVAALRSAGTAPTDPGRSWWSNRDPLDVASQVAGCTSLVILGYLTAITALHLAATAIGMIASGRRTGTTLSSLARRLGPRWLASIAATAALAGVGASGCTGTPLDGPATRTTDPTRAITMTLDITTPTRATDDTPALPPVTMVVEQPPVQRPAPEPPAVEQVPAPPATEQPPAPPVHEPSPAVLPRTVEVLRGESFWSIARREVTARLGRPATAEEVGPYWRDLIELNRSRLVDESDPNLLYPGQLLRLP